MAEYIEREAVLALKKPFPTSKDSVTLYQQYFISPTAVEKIPAADVVPVVRCGECIFHEIADYGGGRTKNVCRLLNRQIQNDDYCSYGMRKDGDGDV